MKYLLDTNVFSDFARFPNGPVANRLSKEPSESLATSAIVLAEITFGVDNVRSRVNTRAQRTAMTLKHAPLPFTPEDAHAYSRLRLELTRSGVAFGGHDLLVAAQASRRRLTLVTRDAGIHRYATTQSDLLTVEDWSTAA